MILYRGNICITDGEKIEYVPASSKFRLRTLWVIWWSDVPKNNLCFLSWSSYPFPSQTS